MSKSCFGDSPLSIHIFSPGIVWYEGIHSDCGWYVFRTKAAVQLLKNAARASAARNTQDSYVGF